MEFADYILFAAYAISRASIEVLFLDLNWPLLSHFIKNNNV